MSDSDRVFLVKVVRTEEMVLRVPASDHDEAMELAQKALPSWETVEATEANS